MTDGEHETNSTVDEAPAYIRAIELHREHPVVKHWFHQITPCELLIPGQGLATFLMIEFRDGNHAAMVWGDGQGNWGTGGWRPLSAKRVETESGTKRKAGRVRYWKQKAGRNRKRDGSVLLN